MTRTVLALSLFCGAQPAPSSARYPAVDPPAPALVYAGGRFLRHPRVVTITWKGDDARLVRKLEAFGAWITRGPWWAAVTKGLCAGEDDCMGRGGQASSVRLDEPAPRNATLGALAKRMGAFRTDPRFADLLRRCGFVGTSSG